jgi:hypothetical protein
MAREKKSGQVYIARDSGHAEIKGVPYVFHKGVTRVREGHPLVDLPGFENIFEPVDTGVHYDIEQATAAPGERRDVFLGDATGDVEGLTVAELRDLAHKRGLTPGTKSKQELVSMIEEAGK